MAIGEKTEAWLSEWNATIGGSRAAAVVGQSRFSTPAQVYRQWRGEEPLPDLSESPDIRRGILLEPIARQVLAEVMGTEVMEHDQDDFRYNADFPHAHALPDGWVGGDTSKPVEIKVPRPMTFQKCRLDGLPADWMIQAQHNIAVTDASEMCFAVFCCVTMNVLVVPVKRDAVFIKNLMEQEAMFAEMVDKGHPPVDDVRAPAIDVPKTEGAIKVVTGKNEIADAEAYLEAKSVLAEAEKLVNATKLELLDAMDKPAIEVRRDDGTPLLRCYRTTSPGQRTFDHKAAVAADPSLEKFYKRGDSFVSFRAYDLTQKKGQ